MLYCIISSNSPFGGRRGKDRLHHRCHLYEENLLPSLYDQIDLLFQLDASRSNCLLENHNLSLNLLFQCRFLVQRDPLPLIFWSIFA